MHATTPHHRRHRVLHMAARSTAALPVACTALLCLGCFWVDRVIFQPPWTSYTDTPDVLKIPTPDGVRLAAIHLPNPDAPFTLLCSHGNAEDIGRLRNVLDAMQQHGFAVFAYDYRGYGTSEGTPSETLCYQDADTVYEYLVDQLQIPSDRIIVYGRSLGGAMATYTASQHPVAGLILESSFLSAFRVMTPVPLLPFDMFSNIDRIDRVDCPVLIIHGRQDEIVPFSHGVELFGAAHPPKLCLWVDVAHHNDVVWLAGQDYWDKMAELTQLVQAQQTQPTTP